MIRFTIYNSGDYEIGIGSCESPSEVCKKILPNQKETVHVPKTYRELSIFRDIVGTDPVGFRINKALQEMLPSMMLVFVPHHSMVLISKDDFSKIDFNDPKSVSDASKGELQLLD